MQSSVGASFQAVMHHTSHKFFYKVLCNEASTGVVGGGECNRWDDCLKGTAHAMVQFFSILFVGTTVKGHIPDNSQSEPTMQLSMLAYVYTHFNQTVAFNQTQLKLIKDSRTMSQSVYL